MSASSFVLALVALTLGQPGTPTGSLPPFEYVNGRAIKLDLRFDAARQAEIKEILLFVSQDEGANWTLTSKVGPDAKDITFSGTNDGVYWLRLASVDRFGKQTPENPKAVPPSARVVVDTLKPYLKLTNVQRSGNEIVAAWQVSEDNPSWESFRLEYISASSGFPIAVPNATPGMSGQARFTPNTSGPVTVRLTLRDKAGNESMTTAEVAGSDGTINTASAASPVAPPNTLAAVQPPTLSPPPPLDPPSTEHRTPIPGAPTESQFSAPPPRTFDGRPNTVPARWNPPAMSSVPAEPTPPPIASTNFPPLQQTGVVQTAAQTPAITPVVSPRRPLPPLSYVNSPFVMLEYELSKIGPSGVGSVEIFFTENDGQKWELLARDDKVVGKTSGGRQKGEIELPQDGIYGFTIVVKSQAQLKQELLTEDRKPHGPQPGDVPEIRVEVDTVPPTAEMFPPRRDMTKTNALVLFWKASDKNLSSNPVTLEWAEHREGPWNPIANNLPNSGKHSWQLPDRLPVEVYLRLRVTDLAGNEGIATTPQPITVDLSEPEGRLTSVSVSPRR